MFLPYIFSVLSSPAFASQLLNSGPSVNFPKFVVPFTFCLYISFSLCLSIKPYQSTTFTNSVAFFLHFMVFLADIVFNPMHSTIFKAKRASITIFITILQQNLKFKRSQEQWSKQTVHCVNEFVTIRFVTWDPASFITCDQTNWILLKYRKLSGSLWPDWPSVCSWLKRLVYLQY